MRTMLGLIEPTYGEIEIMGIDVREQPEEVGRLVGFMPDFPAGVRRPVGLGVPRPVRGQLPDSARRAGPSWSTATSRSSG